MEFSGAFPVWERLSGPEREALAAAAVRREARAGELLNGADADCLGLVLVDEGRLRAYLLSDEGREITLYRLMPGELCLFSAACMLHGARLHVMLEAETDAALWVLPARAYKRLMEGSAVLANYTNELMAARFSDVMWLIEQVMWKSLDKRLAAFLLEESGLAGSGTLTLTHEKIAAHMGTAREVVTRLLRYFQSEGWVALARGSVRLTDPEALARVAR